VSRAGDKLRLFPHPVVSATTAARDPDESRATMG